ncbi:hypothetical protein Droror1_Dr00027461 [Drosera rotundifolia]
MNQLLEHDSPLLVLIPRLCLRLVLIIFVAMSEFSESWVNSSVRGVVCGLCFDCLWPISLLVKDSMVWFEDEFVVDELVFGEPCSLVAIVHGRVLSSRVSECSEFHSVESTLVMAASQPYCRPGLNYYRLSGSKLSILERIREAVLCGCSFSFGTIEACCGKTVGAASLETVLAEDFLQYTWELCLPCIKLAQKETDDEGDVEMSVDSSVQEDNEEHGECQLRIGDDAAPGPDDSIYTFTGHTGEVYAVACSPTDTTLVASGGGDDRGFMWKIGGADGVLELAGHEETVGFEILQLG